MRILHLSDLHLDRPFPSLLIDEARARRRELRAAFDRALALAAQRAVDLVTIGGDLWEDEHVTGDTRAYVVGALARLQLPVAIVCGNHDPYLPGGHFARAAWPDSVTIFGGEGLREVRHGEVSIWGIGWGGGVLDLGWLETFRLPDDGRAHLLLIHGSARSGAAGAGDENDRYAPFDPGAVRRAGFVLCLAGHYHGAARIDGVVYPGSPEPFGWGDTGRHGVALVDVEPGREPSVEWIEINQRRYEARELECGGAASNGEIADRLAGVLDGLDGSGLCLRLTLTGQVSPECEVDVVSLAAPHRGRFAALDIDDGTVPGFEYRPARAARHRHRLLRHDAPGAAHLRPRRPRTADDPTGARHRSPRAGRTQAGCPCGLTRSTSAGSAASPGHFASRGG